MEQLLPRLAYLISDVIIFVDVVDAANKDVSINTSRFRYYLAKATRYNFRFLQYFERVYQFAFSAVDRIASAPKPALIILQNKCGSASQLDVEVSHFLFPVVFVIGFNTVMTGLHRAILE